MEKLNTSKSDCVTLRVVPYWDNCKPQTGITKSRTSTNVPASPVKRTLTTMNVNLSSIRAKWGVSFKPDRPTNQKKNQDFVT